MNRNAVIGAAILLAALLALPFIISSTFYLSIATQILIYAVFAMGVNVLGGYGGLVSLGHAGLFGVAAYVGAFVLTAAYGKIVACAAALAATLLMSIVYAAVSLQASGIGFIMITLALGQILWGLAYRWLSLTNGETGVSINTMPGLFGIPLSSTPAFYFLVLGVFVAALAACAIFAGSNLGAALVGARDQPRRMSALGYHVWLIRFLAYLFSGLLSGVAGILFLFYNQFIAPQSLSLTASAEVLLMVISGGAGTLFGPIAGAALVVLIKNVASAYIERWNLLLGAIFVLIVIFMPEGLLPGSIRLGKWVIRSVRRKPPASVESA